MQLAEVQSRLLDVGSAVATPMDTTKSAFKLNRTRFSGEHVDRVEVKADHAGWRSHAYMQQMLLSSGWWGRRETSMVCG